MQDVILRHWQNNKKAKDPKDITNRVLVNEARDLGLNPNKPLYLEGLCGLKDGFLEHLLPSLFYKEGRKVGMTSDLLFSGSGRVW